MKNFYFATKVLENYQAQAKESTTWVEFSE